MSALQQAFEARPKRNKIEEIKAHRSPKEALEALERYAREGYEAISEEDKGYFLKCFGIFDRPATPGLFMLRVRIAGGQLGFDQARAIGECARAFGRDYIDLTTRQQMELRYLRIEDLPTVMARLRAVGISTYQTGIDNFRNILCDPLDGLGEDCLLPSFGLAKELEALFLHDFEWIGALPRKFNTAITGSLHNRISAFTQDCAFVLARHGEQLGYNLYLGGKVGEIAQSADLFCANGSEVKAAFGSLSALFREFGFRDNRNKNRLKFLIEAIGMEALREAICDHAGIAFARSGETLCTQSPHDPTTRMILSDGSEALHVSVPAGIFSGSDLIDAARVCEAAGGSGLRLDVEQSLYLLGVRSADVVYESDFYRRYKPYANPYFAHMISCPGSTHCPFGVIEGKNDATQLSEYLAREVPLKRGHVRLYWSACVKGCGLHGVGDIGFEGCKAKKDGVTVAGVQISIGGSLEHGKGEGRVLHKAIPLEDAKELMAALMRRYAQERLEGESFGGYYTRVMRFEELK